MPLVLPATTVFVLMAAIFALVGWPFVARGVRGIVAAEREREYVVAAQSLGASRWRIMRRHLLPACAGYPAGAGDAAPAGVHPRGGDAVVHRPRISGERADLGDDVAARRRT